MKKYLFILPLILFFTGCNTSPDNTFGSSTTVTTLTGTTTSTLPGTTTTTVPGTTTTTVFNPNVDDEDLNYVFDLSALPVITVTITTAEWNKLLQYYDQNPNNETLIVAKSFTFNKNGVIETETNVGFRLRGNSSRIRPEGYFPGYPHSSSSPDWHHAHFKIDFEEYDDDNRFHKLKSLNLKWFKDDYNYCREVYNYDLFRRFGVWTAPRSSFARLYIKIYEDSTTAYFGVYQMVEPIDRRYLKVRFDAAGQNDGNLWKCATGANLSTPIYNNEIGIEQIFLNESLSFRPCYDLKSYDNETFTNKYQAFTNQAASQIRDFVSKLNGYTGDVFADWITNTMDVDLFLKTYAVSAAVGMWDDYWCNNGSNYYFYFANDGKVYFIPYDYDNSLGISLGGFVANTGIQSFLDWNSTAYDPTDPPLIAKILGVPEFMNKYKFYIEQLINPTNGYFTFTASTNRIRTWNSLISSYVANDTGEDMSIVDSSATVEHWAQTEDYYLLTGDDTYPSANYFRTRIKTACANLGLTYSQYQQ